MTKAAIIPADTSTQAVPVMPTSLREVAELLETVEEDLSWIPFAVRGVMWMRRAAQLDDDAPLNVPAMKVVEVQAHPAFANMAVRGDALVFPDGVPWGPLPGDHRAN